MFQEAATRRRWPRSQRFVLLPSGAEAEESFRSTIVASRVKSGRASFDDARAEWAKCLRLEPDDGVYLGIIRNGPVTLQDIVAALENCGQTLKETEKALDRLVDARLVALYPSVQ